jgi:hypothetical protein
MWANGKWSNANAIYFFGRVAEDVVVEVLCRISAYWNLVMTVWSHTAFLSSLKNSPPIHQRKFPLGHGTSVAFARRLGGPSTSSSVTLCWSSQSRRIYYFCPQLSTLSAIAKGSAAYLFEYSLEVIVLVGGSTLALALTGDFLLLGPLLLGRDLCLLLGFRSGFGAAATAAAFFRHDPRIWEVQASKNTDSLYVIDRKGRCDHEDMKEEDKPGWTQVDDGTLEAAKSGKLCF